jgi:hypothetical protein
MYSQILKTTNLAHFQHLPVETTGNRREDITGPQRPGGHWRKSAASVMDTVKQRLAVAANNHRWPVAATSELVTSGHITHRVCREASAACCAAIGPHRFSSKFACGSIISAVFSSSSLCPGAPRRGCIYCNVYIYISLSGLHSNQFYQ